MANCENPYCLWPNGGCLLKEAVEKPVSRKDLIDHWHTLVDNCPNAEELFPQFLQMVEELNKTDKP